MSLPAARTAAGLAYRESGEGLPLVLLHAFPLTSAMWEPQFAALAGAARLIAPDAPGLGESPAAPDGWTVDGFADQVAALLDALGVAEAVVGGLSMGGYAALAFARRHPGRLLGLILADTKAEPDDDAAKANRDKLIAAVRERGPDAVLDAMLPKLLAPATRRDRPEVERTVRRLAGAQTAEGLAAALAALRDRPDARPGLEEIQVPARVIVGLADEVTPPDAARRMTEAIPHCKQIDILGAGHLSSLERPAEFLAAVRSFLATVQDCPPHCDAGMFSPPAAG